MFYEWRKKMKKNNYVNEEQMIEYIIPTHQRIDDLYYCLELTAVCFTLAIAVLTLRLI
jgi:hypothetical protein